MPLHAWWLVGRAVKEGMLLLTCRLLAALTRLVVPSEAKHVGQVFTELSSPRQASLGHACASV